MPDGHDEPRQYFTPQEASSRLPLLRVIVQDIVNLFQDLHQRRERLNDLRHRSQRSEYSEEVQQMEDDLERDIGVLEEYVRELKELGVELKDPLVGLVDFRAIIDGREVYLCWKLGETDVTWWHELEDGFSGRQPLVAMEETVPTRGATDTTSNDSETETA